MRKIRSLVVDDQVDARDGIRLLLGAYPDFEIVGEAKNGLEAISQIESLKPDLVFLDIQMPGADGFEVIYSLETDKIPRVIFTTAYDQFALKAFEVSAVDYLLKPYSDERFEESLKKVRKEIKENLVPENIQELIKFYEDNHQPSNELDPSLSRQKDSFVIKEKGRIVMIKFVDLLWVEAFDYYSKLHTAKGLFLIRRTIKAIKDELPESFLRIHRSFIVRSDQIAEIKRVGHGNKVVLNNGALLNVSDKYWKSLKAYFNR